MVNVRNKNALYELLQTGVAFEKVQVADGLEWDQQTKHIIELAQQKGVRVESIPRAKMTKRRESVNHEVLVGVLAPKKNLTLEEAIAACYEKDEDPFFVLINRVDFPNNIGVIARTAFAAGVNGLIFQKDTQHFFNEETVHMSLGAIARIPLVKMNIFEALKTLNKHGIPTFSLHMEGENIYESNLVGPAAFILGAEGKGVSDTVQEKCDVRLKIPMKEGIDSLNVGASAAVVLYEKVRQEQVKK